jgi:hypothetical protein
MPPTHFIPLADAATMTSCLRSNKETVLITANRNLGMIPICETFDRSAFEAILAHTECEKVRIYTAMDTNNMIYFVINPVNGDDEDIYLTDPKDEVPINYVIEAGIRCPDSCPPSSDLNS